jgi:hypothetical protein
LFFPRFTLFAAPFLLFVLCLGLVKAFFVCSPPSLPGCYHGGILGFLARQLALWGGAGPCRFWGGCVWVCPVWLTPVTRRFGDERVCGGSFCEHIKGFERKRNKYSVHSNPTLLCFTGTFTVWCKSKMTNLYYLAICEKTFVKSQNIFSCFCAFSIGCC